MAPYYRILLPTVIATSMLVAGFLALTHSYGNAGSEELVDVVTATCSCLNHQSSEQSSSGPANQDHDDVDCLLCQLIAEFHAEVSAHVELDFDSMVCCSVATEVDRVCFRPILRISVRGPPSV